MIESCVLDVDPETGITEIFHYDDETGDVTIETRQDLDDGLLGAVQEAYNSTDERANWKGDLHHVGIVPAEIWYTLKRQANGDRQHFETLLKDFVNDRDFRAFRTRPGVV